MSRCCRVYVIAVLCLGFSVDLIGGSLRDFRRELNAGTHSSLSGQFVIHDAPPTDAWGREAGKATNLVQLDPTLLTVSCERIKKILLNELGANDEWRGRILINLHHSSDPEEAVLVAPVLFNQGWNYRIELPDVLERSRLVSVMVEVLLLEMAERGSSQPAQIPAWLSEGLARVVISSSPMQLVLELPQKTENGVSLSRLFITGRRVDPMTEAHDSLHSTPPLTLEELSWPAEAQMEGEGAEAFRSSAQLFVHELLLLNDGRPAMRAMLPELCRHLNWQLAFRQAFQADFSSQLELEKWWALHVVQFTGRDLSQAWSSEESWQKLDEILRPEMQVNLHNTEDPLRAQVSLQSIIRNWDHSRQSRVLQEKVQQLSLLRNWVSQDVVRLVDAYRQTLEDYLRKRQLDVNFNFPMGRNLARSQPDNIEQETLRQLDELEAYRQKIRPEPAPAVAAISLGN